MRLPKMRSPPMTSWPRGQAEVEQLLHRRELVRVTGSAADGSQLLAQAGRTATTAAGPSVICAVGATSWSTLTIRPTQPAKTKPGTASTSRNS